MNPLLIFSWLPVIGVIVGLTRARSARLPWIAAGALVLLYGLYMAAYGVYAAQCWDCRGVTETRGDSLIVAAIFFGLMLVATLLGVWLGARLTGTLGRLLGAARDVRDAMGRSGNRRGA